ncbi:diguanylate cyclase [Arcobacter aquimarinus]|uniref:diguanylate cyclase n=1 Tax=Arcobacter aquimarinus TaxID=1315211 RepID=UPI003BAF319D
MKILYVENDKKLIACIDKHCSKTTHEIILIESVIDALLCLKESNEVELIITELNHLELDILSYLKEIRNLKKDIPIIITSNNLDLKASLKEFSELNILSVLEKPFDFDKLKILIEKLDENKRNFHYKEKIRELKLFIKPFKEFSFYSETDLEGKIVDISDSFCHLVGFKKEELIGKKHSIFKHPMEDNTKYKEIWKNLLNGNSWVGELKCLDKLGNDIWYKTIIFPKRNENQEIIGYAAKRQDITEKKYVELLSITNDLTGLYNKRFFKQTLENERNRVRRDKKNLVFIMIDVDNFKKYNDLYGHLKGDQVLKQIAEILKINSRRTNDFAFRLGGEEFAIITSITPTLSLSKIIRYTEKIRKEVLNKRIEHLRNENIGFVTVSLGVFNYKLEMNYSCDEIYRFADIALYEAKNSGRNKVVIYNK